ncbi:hypothetical protein GCM10011323_11820 [Pontibacter amylolyticus]|nr:hypothetical protein GCM10011323_11820 [Pontibacter amylolyticus]
MRKEYQDGQRYFKAFLTFKRLSLMKKLYFDEDALAYIVIAGYFAVASIVSVIVAY